MAHSLRCRGREQRNNAQVPHGRRSRAPPGANSTATRARSDRLGLELSLNIQSGWNLGGPMSPPTCAEKTHVVQLRVTAPPASRRKLAAPCARKLLPRFVRVAYRVNPELPKNRRPLQNLVEKALLIPPLRPSVRTDQHAAVPGISRHAGEEDARAVDVIDLTAQLTPSAERSGRHRRCEWSVLLRFTLNDTAASHL